MDISMSTLVRCNKLLCAKVERELVVGTDVPVGSTIKYTHRSCDSGYIAAYASNGICVHEYSQEADTTSTVRELGGGFAVTGICDVIRVGPTLTVFSDAQVTVSSIVYGANDLEALVGTLANTDLVDDDVQQVINLYFEHRKGTGGGGGGGTTIVTVNADLKQTDPNEPDYVKGKEIIDTKIQDYAQPKSEKGAANGLATLDEKGKVPLSQLPDGINIGPDSVDFSVKNLTGWLSKTIAYGAKCKVYLEWSSIEDDVATGNGTVKILVDDVVKTVYEVEQGTIEVDIDNYLLMGKNSIGVDVSDVYGKHRTIVFTISCVKVSIDSYFDGNVAYTGVIPFSYTPTGTIEKTVYFIIDGEDAGTQVVTVSGREQTFNIPAQTHGHHTLEVYFTGKIDEQPVESNRLYYDLICYEEDNDIPIIACVFNTESVKQFATIPLMWVAYTPKLLTTEVTIADNFGYTTTRTADRTVQTLSYKADNVGLTEITFSVGGKVLRTISVPVLENKIDVYAETTNLELYLASKGRSNNDVNVNPLEWSFGDIAAELTGFNLTTDCWQPDDNGDVVLRVNGDARVHIPFNIFGTDFRTNGKTIEFEFATRDVLNYDSVIISAWSGNRGLQITAQKALLKSEKSEIFTQYKEDEHIRIAFSVEKRAKHRLLSIYLNGVLSGVKQYADNDDFSQAEPVGISIGSSECTTDIYCIRVYGNDLSRYQILDNWIADTQNLEQLVERYERNNIYDEYGEVTIDTLPANIPYLVIECPKLPQTADDEFTCNGYYVDPLQPKKCFTFNGATVAKQGTSSMAYKIGNLKLKYKGGFIIDGVQYSVYQLRDTSVGTATFTYKADVASIEGANNLQLARLYDDTCPVKTPPQKEDSKVRQGIDGLPIVIFHDNGETVKFMGKYNFNNDKGTPEVFGFKDGDECWSVEVNTSDRVLYKSDDFSGDAWKDDFESRFPKNYYGKDRLHALVSWVKSTDREQATNSRLSKSVEYDGTVYTHDTVEYRFVKFRNEAPTIFNIESLKFFYLFTSFHLMIDNWAKNTFPTYFAADGKWYMLPYDFDTALGINNEGQLVFGYSLEDTDILESGAYVFNGQNSVLMTNVRDCFRDEIKALYKELRSTGKFDFNDTINRFSAHQNVWGEAIFNEDMSIKHLDALFEDNNPEYLPMALGKKELQRMHWLYNRYRYMDSYYVAGDSLTDKITFRGYQIGNIVMTPYADIYTTVEWASAKITQGRTPRGVQAIHECPLDKLNDTEINIYSASQLTDLGDLSPLKIGGFNDFSCATKIKSLKLGDGGDYRNGNLHNLSLGNNTLLRTLDVRNCYNLAESVDVRGCTNLEYAYFDGTAITGLDLPDGGILKALHLPSTVTSLDIRNQPLLKEFSMLSYENLTTLRLENLDIDLFDTLSMVLQMPANSRVRVLGVDWTIDTAEEIFEVFNKLDGYRGLDEYGNNVDNPQISGVIHTGTITSNDYAEMKRRYPNFTIDYEHITSVVSFYIDGVLACTPVIVYDGADCLDPITEGIINTPTRPETGISKYVYSSWDHSLKSITADTVVNAVFDEYMKYFVTFKDDRGTIVPINGNLTNVYYDIDGERVITVPGDLDSYSKVLDGTTYDYHFEYWRNAETGEVGVVDVCGDDYSITYEAVFSEHRVNVVKFMNDDEVVSELHLYEGGYITVPTNPSKVSTAQYNFSFKGWSLDGSNVVNIPANVGNENITYYAVYDNILRQYMIDFLDYDGTLIRGMLVDYGTVPFCEEPTRQATAQFFYDFDGWSPNVEAVTGDTTYMATYMATLRTYTVKWVNEDGTSLLEEDINVPYGTMPSYGGATPTKAGNAQYTYTFAGWHIDVSAVTGHITYIATYTAEVNKYKVTWKNEDGTVLETDEKVPYGDMPEYNGSTPTKTSTAQYDFAFAGWDTAVSEVTGDVVYTATYTEHIRSYAIKFVDYNDTVLKSEVLEYGTMPSAPTPSRTGYDFTGWDSSITAVTGAKTYKAQYKIKVFTIKFVDYNGTVLSTQSVNYGAMPTTPSNPSRTGYDFTGWDSSVVSATADKTYTAQYKIQTFTIKFVNADGTVLYSNNFEYGSVPTYSGNTPTKTSTAQYDYVFAGWGNVVAVTGEATYIAQFTESVRSYTVTWKNDDGTVLKTETVKYGTTPTYSGTTPTKLATAQYTYTHNGWTPSVAAVTGNVTYTATYTSTVRTYTITWKIGAVTKTTTCAYGSVPTPPYSIGQSVTQDGLTYTIQSWGSIATVTGDATYTATVKGSGSITSRFTKLAFCTFDNSSRSQEDWIAFVNGTASLETPSVSDVGRAHLYGFDCRQLQNLNNVVITDIKVSITGKRTKSSPACTVMPIHSFSTEFKFTTSYLDEPSYTKITDSCDFKSNLTTSVQTLTKSFNSTMVTWANSNLNKFIGGYNSNSFGIRVNTYYTSISKLELIVEFTFG